MRLPMMSVLDKPEAEHRHKVALGSACTFESMVMTLLLAVALATFMWLTSFAMAQADESRRLTEATAMAETAIEEAIARCSDDPDSAMVGMGDIVNASADLVASVSVSDHGREAGRMLRIEVSVRRLSDDSRVYYLRTDRYVPDARGGGQR